MSDWHIDWLLFLLILILVIFGAATLISIGAFQFPSYLIYILLALAAFFLFTRIDYMIYRNFDWIFYILALLLLTTTLVLGSATRGAVRWLNIGLIVFQTSELVKPLMILSFAGFGLKLSLKKFNGILIYFGLTVPLLFLVFKQPDLGNTFIYAVIFVAIYYCSGGRWLFLVLLILVTIGVSPLVWHFLHEYQRKRVREDYLCRVFRRLRALFVF